MHLGDRGALLCTLCTLCRQGWAGVGRGRLLCTLGIGVLCFLRFVGRVMQG